MTEQVQTTDPKLYHFRQRPQPSIYLVEMIIVRRPNQSMESKIRPIVHIKILILIYRPIPSMRCTVHDQKFVHFRINILVQRPNLFMRWTVWAQILVRCPHGRMDGP